MFLAIATSGLFLIPSAVAAGSTPPDTRMTVNVKQGNWGAVKTQDIKTVLTFAADALLPYFPQHAADKVLVSYTTQGPRVLFEKSPDGTYLVFLNVQDTRWDQFTYQFSHELCHIFTNFEHREIRRDEVNRDHQWFEETLCEAVSLFALTRVASRWEESPPYPGWKSYAPALREYAQRLLAARNRDLPSNKSIEEWYGENQGLMEDNPYSREKNELLATQLLPLLESTPGSMEAVGFLNRERSSSPENFEAYLKSWYSCCPEKYRDFISRVISMFSGPHRKDRTVATLRTASTLFY